MPVIKVNFFFQKEQGWSETWYYNEPGELGDATIAAAKVLAQKRARLLGSDASLFYVRCSDEAIRGDSVVTADVPQMDKVINGKCDPAFAGFITRCEAGGNNRKVFCLRGVPRVIMYDNFRSLALYGTWLRAFNEFALALQPKGGNWGVRCLDKTATNPRAPIISIFPDPANAGELTVTVNGALNLVNGASVRLSGIKFAPTGKAFNGLYRISRVAGQAFNIPGQPPIGAYTGKGFCWPRVFVVRGFDDVFIERTGSHKVGNVFGHARGRQKARV